VSQVAAGLLLLRIVVGLLFAAHGLQKLLGWFGGAGLDGTAKMFDRGGLRPGRVTAPLGGAAELAGGASIALGFLTPLGSIAVLLMMAGAVVAVHGSKGLWNTNGGSEFPTVLGSIALALTLTGPGRWSIDHLAGLQLAGWGWFAAACVITAIGTMVVLAMIRANRMREPSTRQAPPQVRDRVRDRHVA
jgi:putative oxidoreductase